MVEKGGDPVVRIVRRSSYDMDKTQGSCPAVADDAVVEDAEEQHDAVEAVQAWGEDPPGAGVATTMPVEQNSEGPTGCTAVVARQVLVDLAVSDVHSLYRLRCSRPSC